jgi:hypothetical protein
MQVLLEIKDSKAAHFLEVVKDLSYIKMTKLSPEKDKKKRLSKTKAVKPISKEKVKILKGIEGAVKEFNLVRAGKKKARDAREFLNEL